MREEKACGKCNTFITTYTYYMNDKKCFKCSVDEKIEKRRRERSDAR